jgi:hypothetical protein
MVSPRSSVASLTRLSTLAAVGLPLVVALGGCSLMHHEAAAGDAGPSDAAAVVAVIDASVAPPPTPDNVNQVGRFPDEVAIGDVAAKIADPNVSARNAVPGGALVATLRLGTPVTQIAKHDTFILCVFPDPKSSTRTLEGWIAEQAFVPGPTVPSKASCPVGQVRLIVTADDQDFCGRVCKNDSDCQSGQVCSGKANLFANGKPGADVDTCTMPLPGAPAPSNAGKPVPGIQVPPPAGKGCPAGFVLTSGDKLCHLDCTKGPCPAGAKCTHALAAAVCEAL